MKRVKNIEVDYGLVTKYSILILDQVKKTLW